MSARFEVTVLEKEDVLIKLRVRIIHPEQKIFFDTRRFGLKLLIPEFYKLPNSRTKKNGFISSKISLKIYSDDLKMAQIAFAAIKSIDIIETHNFPNPIDFVSMSDDEIRSYWYDLRENLPEAITEIEVREAGWLEHLTAGMKYDSYAWDEIPAKYYKDRTFISGMDNTDK